MLFTVKALGAIEFEDQPAVKIGYYGQVEAPDEGLAGVAIQQEFQIMADAAVPLYITATLAVFSVTHADGPLRLDSADDAV